jgi:uncharacterized protein YukE
MQKHKHIQITQLTLFLKQQCEQVIKLFEELKSDIEQKRDEVKTQSLLITAEVARLKSSGKVEVNQDEYKRSEESITHYVELLDNIVNDINQECNIFSQCLDNKNTTIEVTEKDPDIFEEFVSAKIHNARRYVKTVKRDLAISFSRYHFGFDAQLKRIAQIELYLKNHKK